MGRYYESVLHEDNIKGILGTFFERKTHDS